MRGECVGRAEKILVATRQKDGSGYVPTPFSRVLCNACDRAFAAACRSQLVPEHRGAEPVRSLCLGHLLPQGSHGHQLDDAKEPMVAGLPWSELAYRICQHQLVANESTRRDHARY